MIIWDTTIGPCSAACIWGQLLFKAGFYLNKYGTLGKIIGYLSRYFNALTGFVFLIVVGV